jgi:hypothetical protein
MSSFKVKIINLDDQNSQDGGMKFLKKMGSTLKKGVNKAATGIGDYRKASKARDAVRKAMRKNLAKKKSNFLKDNDVAQEVNGLDKGLAKPIFKQLNSLTSTGTMGMMAGKFVKALNNVDKKTLIATDPKDEDAIEKLTNDTLKTAMQQFYPSNDFDDFADKSLRNSIKTVYEEFRKESLKKPDTYSEITENTSPSISDIQNVYAQMQADKQCSKIGLKVGETCNSDSISQHKKDQKEFNVQVKKIQKEAHSKVKNINALISKYNHLIEAVNNLDPDINLNADNSEVSNTLESFKGNILKDVWDNIFPNNEKPQIINEIELYKQLRNNFYKPKIHSDGAFTAKPLAQFEKSKSNVGQSSSSPSFKTVGNLTRRFREGDLNQEGGHLSGITDGNSKYDVFDDNPAINDDQDKYGINFSDIVSSSRKSSRKKSKKRR